MEFKGRIVKLMPTRSGMSQRTGNEWKALPFVFEYFENESDRYADSVLLETFDTKVIENLKEGMEVRCGFSHKVREYTKQDGTPVTINELRLYKIESVKKVAVEQHQTQQNQASAPAPQPQVQKPDDDLPF